MIDKVFHHIAFTLFWGLLIAVIITSFMRWAQWEDSMIKECMEKRYPEAICRGM